MKAHEFISALDDAKYGHRVTEDKAPVGETPSHAPTSTAQWKTSGKGKSDDQGGRTGGEKDAIKKSETAMPAPVAKEPTHAPTSTAQWKTKGEVHSDDQGEKISKEAVKEEFLQKLINADDEQEIREVMGEMFLEGGHKPGCKCGFCMNKGKFGKKDDGEKKEDDEKDDMSEARLPLRSPQSRTGFGMSAKPGGMIRGRIGSPRRLGGERMNFRHPSAMRPRPKAAMAPYQPSMERLDTSNNASKTIQEMADELLESPDIE